jgi:hypothetical protein
MANRPKDNRPATEETSTRATDVGRGPEYPARQGEVKVIKNEKPVDPGKTPGSAEAGVQRGEPTSDLAGKTPGSAESGEG